MQENWSNNMYALPPAPLIANFRGVARVILYFCEGIEILHACTGQKIEICREQVSSKLHQQYMVESQSDPRVQE